jgi:hypothetical protein
MADQITPEPPNKAEQTPRRAFHEAASAARSPQSALEAVAGATRYRGSAAKDGSELFSCQATEINRFSRPLPWWDLRQYVRDLRTRNLTILEFLIGLCLGVFHKIQDLRGQPGFGVVSGVDTQTPQATLDLSPGDLVQIRPMNEIVATLDRRGRNAGLKFRPVMSRYCEKQYRVLRRVTKIDPASREMISLRGNSVILDGVLCTGKMRRFCPRMVYTYWRDVWLKKVTPQERPNSTSDRPSGRQLAVPTDQTAVCD